MPQKYTLSNYDENLYHDGTTRFLHLTTVSLLTIMFVFDELYSRASWFWIFVILAIIYNVAPYFTSRFQRLSHRMPTIIINFISFFFLNVFFIPSGTPLELIGFTIVATGAYWLGIQGFLLSFLSVTAGYITADLYQNAGAFDDLPNLILKIVMLAILGGFISRFTTKDQLERRKLIEFSQEANYERRRLLSLINSMADAVIATNNDGNILLYNGAALGLLNTNQTLSNEKLQNYLKLVDQSSKSIDIIAMAKNNPRIIQRDDLRFKNNEGEYVNLYIDLAPIRLNSSQNIEDGFIVLLRDITKEKTIEEQRDEFISIVSHELRTPIAITEANISTAMLPTIKGVEQRQELMSQAHKNVVYLASLVNDITTLAHAEQGSLDTELTELDAPQIALELAKNYQQTAKEKKLKIKVNIEDSLPPILSNTNRLKEILQDFIINAIKYTDKGSVTIRLTKQAKVVRFSIIDTGIGISTTDRHKVFEKFYRSEDYRTRSHSGTGLGLYIAKRLAELIHATIGVESKLDHGSTFFIEVPVYKTK